MSERQSISPIWRLAQAVSVAGALGVVGLLVLRPELGLHVTWDLLIPLVPALLLVAPRVWRNLCPIAVVHQIPRRAGRGGRRYLPNGAHLWMPLVAGSALFLIVPLRHVVFNHHGPALALFVVAILTLAVIGGLLYAGKSGWCSTFCPVGPVERLYGQQPMIEPHHAHCSQCVGCTSPCFDREGPAAVEGLVDRPGSHMLRSPMGLFAAAFPGFILGYFTVPGDAALGAIYGHVFLLAAVSAAAFGSLQLLIRFKSMHGIAAAAALAAGAYYWFTVPSVLASIETMWGLAPLPGWVDPALRGAALALVVGWLATVPQRSRQRLPQARGAASAG